MTNIYVLKKFTSHSVASTKLAWNLEIKSSGNVFANSTFLSGTWGLNGLVKSQDIEVAKGHSQNFVYGIFAQDTLVADAIVMLIVSNTSKKVVKLIDCFIRPSIAEVAYLKDIEAIEKLSKIYMAAILGTIDIAERHAMRIVKVYGRSEPLLVVLNTIAEKIKAQSSTLFASIEGRWLVISDKT